MFPKETRILVVDDSATARGLLGKILGDMGYTRVAQVGDGEPAVEAILNADQEGAPFGLVLSDCKMPRMDGIQLLNFIRKSSPTPDVPFLLITAEGETDTVLGAIQGGANGYLLKPLSPQVLQDRLAKVWNAKSKQ